MLLQVIAAGPVVALPCLPGRDPVDARMGHIPPHQIRGSQDAVIDELTGLVKLDTAVPGP